MLRDWGISFSKYFRYVPLYLSQNRFTLPLKISGQNYVGFVLEYIKTMVLETYIGTTLFGIMWKIQPHKMGQEQWLFQVFRRFFRGLATLCATFLKEYSKKKNSKKMLRIIPPWAGSQLPVSPSDKVLYSCHNIWRSYTVDLNALTKNKMFSNHE